MESRETNLFITGIPNSFNESDLEKRLEIHGHTETVKLLGKLGHQFLHQKPSSDLKQSIPKLAPRSGRELGPKAGFVRFTRHSDARLAKEMENGLTWYKTDQAGRTSASVVKVQLARQLYELPNRGNREREKENNWKKYSSNRGY